MTIEEFEYWQQSHYFERSCRYRKTFQAYTEEENLQRMPTITSLFGMNATYARKRFYFGPLPTHQSGRI
jgi:hypothetical protein